MPHILLIDDDDDLRAMLTAALTLHGHSVTEAQNGRAGLLAVKKDRPDLIITDISMPEMEGLGFLVELKKINSKTKVIAISGGGAIGGEQNLRIAKLMGAADTLMKPFRVESLRKCIDGVLANSTTVVAA